jgi:hypothetical protein
MKAKHLILLLSVMIFGLFSCGKKQNNEQAENDSSKEAAPVEVKTEDLQKITFQYPEDWTFLKDENEGTYMYDTQQLHKTDNTLYFISLYVTNSNGRSMSQKKFLDGMLKNEKNHKIIKEVNSYGKYTGEGVVVAQKRSGYEMENLYFSALRGDSVLFQILVMKPKRGKEDPGYKIFEESLTVK